MKLSALEEKLEALREIVSDVIEFPEPAFKLDLANRRGDTLRQFKYLHQMCTIQRESFVRSNQINSVAILEGYLSVCRDENPIGPYLFARTLLELGAFLNDVSRRLQKIAKKKDEGWKSKGEEFFSLIIRARFGTSDPKHAKHLTDIGISRKLMKPINVMGSIDLLNQKSKTKKLAEKYDMLCDYVIM